METREDYLKAAHELLFEQVPEGTEPDEEGWYKFTIEGKIWELIRDQLNTDDGLAKSLFRDLREGDTPLYKGHSMGSLGFYQHYVRKGALPVTSNGDKPSYGSASQETAEPVAEGESVMVAPNQVEQVLARASTKIALLEAQLADKTTRVGELESAQFANLEKIEALETELEELRNAKIAVPANLASLIDSE